MKNGLLLNLTNLNDRKVIERLKIRVVQNVEGREVGPMA